MLGGLPQFVIRAAKTPKISPARIIHTLGVQNLAKLASFSIR